MRIVIYEAINKKENITNNHISKKICNQLDFLNLQYINDTCDAINVKLQI